MCFIGLLCLLIFGAYRLIAFSRLFAPFLPFLVCACRIVFYSVLFFSSKLRFKFTTVRLRTLKIPEVRNQSTMCELVAHAKSHNSDMWPCVTHPSKSCHDKCKLLLNMTHFLYCIDQFSKFDWPLTLWSLLYTSLVCKYVTAGRGQICFKAWSEGNVRASRALQTTIRDAIRVVGH